MSDFPRPAFARDHDRQIGVHDPRDEPVERLHRRCAPDERKVPSPTAILRLRVSAHRGAALTRQAPSMRASMRSGRSKGFGR